MAKTSKIEMAVLIFCKMGGQLSKQASDEASKQTSGSRVFGASSWPVSFYEIDRFPFLPCFWRNMEEGTCANLSLSAFYENPKKSSKI